MNPKHIQQILTDQAFPDIKGTAELIETHISWVILTAHFAFKIKKPLKYPFLDFSTLDRRKFYCERELIINRRLVKKMYLEVLPVREQNGKMMIGGQSGFIVDYAVKMKRQDTSRQMNLLLEAGLVNEEDMRKLAEQIATFHARAEVIQTGFDLEAIQNDFADISKVQPFLAIHLGEKVAGVIARAVDYSDHFLSSFANRFRERIQMGFTIDGHGDLHSKNIFLLENGSAIIFDCIEFSDHFRQVDVLNELAFFGMDLDFYGRSDLEKAFLDAYFVRYPVLIHEDDWQIYHYYKLYRANVRVKINALKTMQSPDEKEMLERMGLVKAYLSLLEKYLEGVRPLGVLVKYNR